jgi:S-adenosylmethionine:tRNA ribosyltransferase-isomerase
MILMEPKNLSINDFTYHLPDEKIAKYPLPNRDDSKLLIYEDGHIKQSKYHQISNEIPSNSLMVFNNTKVVEARLLFTKETGSTIEIFCLEPAAIYADITTAMLQKNKVLWKCLVGGAKKWKQEVLYKQHEVLQFFQAKKIEQKQDYFLIEFSWNNDDISFAEVLHILGEIPLPPYLNRAVEEDDKKTYQTVYAKHDGSVAAPTAGLHFTENIFQSFKEKNIQQSYITLHVGAGTFKPVKSATMQDHEMHQEFFEVSFSFINQLIESLYNNIIVVGTTSLRTIETLYWMGVKALSNTTINAVEDLQIYQWDAYQLPQYYSTQQSLTALKEFMQANKIDILVAKTQIIIAPPYQLKVANALVTNFHQPKSTLLLLVASILKDDWKKVYNYALENNFRFLSYGDGSILWYAKK